MGLHQGTEKKKMEKEKSGCRERARFSRRKLQSAGSQREVAATGAFTGSEPVVLVGLSSRW